MNGHPARPGDVVEVHHGVRVDNGHDLSGMRLTVQSTAQSRRTSAIAIQVDPANEDKLALTEWTGCPPVWIHESDVDVIAHVGVA
jgi:hypothetical protein